MSDVEGVFARREVNLYEPATQRYLALLRSGEVPPQALARAHLAAGKPLPPGQLATWWDARDPLPATDINDRVLEHLMRSATALESFPADRPAGVDGRGELFIRFGAPFRRRVIDVMSDLLISRLVRADPSVSPSDFPLNEVWYYPDLGRDVFFVLVARGDDYQIASPTDLVPVALQSSGFSYATRNRGRLLALTLRWVYKDIAEFSADIRQRLLVLDNLIGADGVAFYTGTGRPNTAMTLQTEVQRGVRDDETAAQNRDRQLVPSVTRAQAKSAGVVRRTAVFRDGAPGSFTYSAWTGWALPSDAVAQLGEAREYRVGLLGVRRAPDYTREGEGGRSLEAGVEGLAPQWITIDGLAEGGHAGVQWDVTPVADGQPLTPYPVAQDVALADSVRLGPLSLSGLLPVDVDQARDAVEIDRLTGLPRPDPSLAVAPGASLALYYEVYVPDPDAEVTLGVQVLYLREARLLRAARERTAGSQTTFAPGDTRVPQLAVVDLDDLNGVDEVRVEVTLTDEQTGASAQRTISYGVLR